MHIIYIISLTFMIIKGLNYYEDFQHKNNYQKIYELTKLSKIKKYIPIRK